MNDTATAFNYSRVREFPVWLRFALLCTLFLLAAVWLEPHLGPLCRAMALQVGSILRLAGYALLVRDDLITLSGFSVRIIGECTAIHPVLLLAAFVLATPATWGRRASGMLLGGAFLMTVNILRIAAITTIGAALPELFQILHVYLGQVIMLLLVVATALVWQRHNSSAENPLPFLLRALVIATLLYLPWLAFNLTYVELIDYFVSFLFSMFNPGYLVSTPRPFAIYNHTFSVPLLLALILAGRNVSIRRRLVGTITGVLILAAWHALFRSSHVLWTAFDLPIATLHEAIYLIGQFLLPFLIWLRMAGLLPAGIRSPIGNGRSILPVSGIVLLLGFLICPVEALADSVVSAYSNSRGSFTIMANNLNRITEAEININYQSDDPTPPKVSSSYLDNSTKPANTPGSIVIRIKSKKPLSGYVPLAIAQIRGSITYLTAVLRNESGTIETAQVSITNPPQEQLDAMAAQWSKSIPKDTDAKNGKTDPAVTAENSDSTSLAQTDAANPTPTGIAKPPGRVVASPPAVVAADAGVRQTRKEEEMPHTLRFSRRESLSDRFRASSGERTAATLTGLLQRNDTNIVQDPPLLLSDGTASLKLTVRTPGLGAQAPQFFISGGNCTNLKIGEKGAWILEIIPEKGVLTASVTVLAGWEAIEYPLAVAPPLELFDATKTGPDLAEFVRVANALKKN